MEGDHKERKTNIILGNPLYFPPISKERTYKLEICVDNLDSAAAAVKAGADRLEICQALDVGGLTPTSAFIAKVKKLFKNIPIFMLVRPRTGNFIYSDDEVDIMKRDMETSLYLGIDGFVTGALRVDGGIDNGACRKLMEAACGKPVTFHRAYDVSGGDFHLKDIISLGFKRVLTSGRRKTAKEGILNLKNLIEQAQSQIIIMPGSGIDSSNICDILHGTGATEFHSSGKDLDPPRFLIDDVVVKGSGAYPVTSYEAVKRMLHLLRVEERKKNRVFKLP